MTGVLKAVKNVEQLAAAIKGMDPTDQEAIDKKVIFPLSHTLLISANHVVVVQRKLHVICRRSDGSNDEEGVVVVVCKSCRYCTFTPIKHASMLHGDVKRTSTCMYILLHIFALNMRVTK